MHCILNSYYVVTFYDKGLGLSQQAKTDTARQGLDLAVLRECGHTPYACYDSVLSELRNLKLKNLLSFHTHSTFPCYTVPKEVLQWQHY